MPCLYCMTEPLHVDMGVFAATIVPLQSQAVGLVIRAQDPETEEEKEKKACTLTIWPKG